MDKKTLLYLWGAVHAITQDVKHGHKNEWGEQNGGTTESLHIGCDEVAIYRLPDKTIVAVNGSDKDRKEWGSNFNALPTIRGVHRGFRKSAKQVLSVIKSKLPCGLPVVLVGHSRGGAIVQVMAYRSKRSMQCVTFGSPRPFSVLAMGIRFVHHMVHCKQDPVCHIPPVFIPPFWKTYLTSETEIVIRDGKKGVDESHKNYGVLIERWL